jgi:hypothetical protein
MSSGGTVAVPRPESDLDLDQAVVKIERSAVEVGTAVVVKAPKTAAGVRTVALPAWLVPELAHHLATYADPAPDGRVFVGLCGATPLRRNFATIWKRAKQAAGAGVPDDRHFDDLRHAGNPFAASGASTRELVGRMGHASCADLPAPDGGAGSDDRRLTRRDDPRCGVTADNRAAPILGTFWARARPRAYFRFLRRREKCL